MLGAPISPLRVRLLGLVAIAIIPVAMYVAWLAHDERGAARARAQASTARLLDISLEQHETAVRGARTLAQSLTDEPELIAGDAETCGQRLAHTFVPDAGHLSAARVSADLRVDCVSRRSRATAEELAALLPASPDALLPPDTTEVRYRTGADGTALALLLHPAYDRDGRLLFLVAVDLALPWMQALAAAIPQGPGSMTALADASGFIYARFPDAEGFAGRQHVPNQALRDMIGGSSGVIEGTGLDGIERVYAFRQVPAANRQPVVLSIGIPVSVLYGDASRYLRNTLLVAIGAVLLAMLMAWIASDLFVLRGVRRLLGATQELTAGRLSTRVPAPRAGGELTALAVQFNTLAQRLEERWREFIALGDSSPDAIVRLDGDLRIEWANATVTRWLGVEVDQITGRRLEEVGLRRQASAGGQMLALLRNALDTGEPQESEVMLTAPDGERAIDLRVVPERDAAGTVRHLLMMARDVTARRRLERQVAQSERLDSIGKLAGSVAHDFNNLLTAIIGNAEFALRALEPGTRVHADVAEILDVARRASSLTRQLLSFARRQPTTPRVIEVNPFIEDVATLLRRLLGASIALDLRLDPDAPRIRFDPTHLEQMLVNFATNARDAMPAGGTMTITTGRAVREAAHPGANEALPEGEYLHLQISDTGHGMTPEVRRRLFEPFFTTKRDQEGTGLGLAVTYGVVRQYGGRIDVHSSVGQGATFDVLLPATREALPTEPFSASGASPPPGRHETILLVEDQEAVRSMLARLLRSHGYVVVEARDGVEALERCEQGAVDDMRLLVTDLVMPRMGGEALLTRFRATCPNLPVIVITGYDERGTARALLERGEATALLEKPFDPQELLRLARALIDRAAAAAPGELPASVSDA